MRQGNAELNYGQYEENKGMNEIIHENFQIGMNDMAQGQVQQGNA
jgi:hypothetical protein